MPSARSAVEFARMTTVYDQSAALTRMGEDYGLFVEMIGLFEEDAPRRLEELADALRRQDSPLAERAAHSLKGMAANFSATGAQEAAGQVERLAKAQSWQALAPASTTLHHAIEELVAALRRARLHGDS